MFQDLGGSTRFAHVCTVLAPDIQQNFVKKFGHCFRVIANDASFYRTRIDVLLTDVDEDVSQFHEGLRSMIVQSLVLGLFRENDFAKQ